MSQALSASDARFCKDPAARRRDHGFIDSKSHRIEERPS
jgi:hypothetical protein